MSTYTQILYHIVFSTKNRGRVLTESRREDLFGYVWGILRNKQCHPYCINGVADHIHILCAVHPTVRLADVVREIKNGTHSWIKEENAFPAFDRWQDGYSAFTLSIREKSAVIEYIKNQAEHHCRRSFREELRDLLDEADIKYDEKYLP